MNFGQVLEGLKSGGNKFARRGWNGARMYISLQRPDQHSANRQAYIFIVPVGGQRVPWVASHPDLLEEDWYSVSDIKE